MAFSINDLNNLGQQLSGTMILHEVATANVKSDLKGSSIYLSRTSIIIKVMKNNHVKCFGSGSHKFEIDWNLQKSGRWTSLVSPLPGTTRDDALGVMEAYSNVLSQPKPKHKRSPNGFIISKLGKDKHGKQKVVGESGKKNFNTAISSCYYHTKFTTFCRKNNVTCKFKKSSSTK